MIEKVTIATLKQMKSVGEKIACLTSYDASFARLQDASGVDVLLVGDSLGMVLHGDETTHKVTMSDMIYHTQLVHRARRRAMIISDLPYKSYQEPIQAFENASALINQGADLVKLEGGTALKEIVRALSRQDISVCGHLGILPQTLQQPSDYQVQAKTKQAAAQLKKEALILQEAGAVCLVLECVRAKVAQEVTQLLDIPVIGIGSGVDCDAQVLVVYDMLGLSAQHYKFSKNFLTGKDSVMTAFEDYVAAVKNKSFPGQAHSYQ